MRIDILRELPTCDDWDYWLRAALQDYSFIRVATYGSKHRQHDASLSKHEIPALQGRHNAAQAAAVQHELVRTSFFRDHVPFPLMVIS